MSGFCKFKHGLWGTREYNAWKRIKARCYNKKSKDYCNYGAVGIYMDDLFKDDFLEFLNHIGKIPNDTERWSVDRIDNSKGYLFGNIRWAIDTQQARNKGSYRNNSSGVNGVYWLNNKFTYAVASWYEEVGGKLKQRSKSFSVNKYGLLPAFSNAVKYRNSQIVRLNENGYGYSEGHGK